MQSIIHSVAPGLMPQTLPPWQKLDWSEDIQKGIFKDWAYYYARRGRQITALYYFDKALELEPDDFVTLFHRSQTNRKTGRRFEALEDSLLSAKLAEEKQGYLSAVATMEVCDALYDLNRFEDCLIEVYHGLDVLTGHKTKAYVEGLDVVNGNLEDSLGDALKQFFLENEITVHEVSAKLKALKSYVAKPLWKELKEKNECDVVSILEDNTPPLSPLELKRRQLAFNKFNQSYLNDTWRDVLFLKQLSESHVLSLPQSPFFSKYLTDLVDTENRVLAQFLSMLNARAPGYVLKYNKFSNKQIVEKHEHDYLCRVQYQTRRDMFNILKTIKELRAKGNIKALEHFIEQKMGDYVVLKTHRIMPWKFEFMNEVYNTLALAYSDEYKLPKNLKITEKGLLFKLLKLRTIAEIEIEKFVFGERRDKSKVAEERATLRSKKLHSRLEKRLSFAKYPIEKVYLLHQIAKNHFEQNRFDECFFSANKAIAECDNCKSILWMFLCRMLKIKSSAILRRVEKTNASLQRALLNAISLRSPQLTIFIEACLAINEHEFSKKNISSSFSVSSSRMTMNTLSLDGTEEAEKKNEGDYIIEIDEVPSESHAKYGKKRKN